MTGFPTEIHLLLFEEVELGHALKYLSFHEGTPLRYECYQIKLDHFLYSGDSAPHNIYSEGSLDDVLLRQLHDISKIINRFYYCPDIYIFEEGYIDNSDHFSELGMMLPSTVLTHPDVENEALLTLYHEFGHTIFKEIHARMRDQRADMLLFNAYTSLVKSAGYQTPLSSKDFLKLAEFDINNQRIPCFHIFDESTYLPVQKNQADTFGHPYENYNELFVSSLTVFRLFPEEFLERFRSLKQKEQVAVRKAAFAIFYVLELVNNDADDLETLIPGYHRFKAVLQSEP